jgi:CheY-like chemotaxis protein
MNLCLNAKDAMEKGGTLSLSAKNFAVDEAYARMHPEAKVGPYLVFSVEDTGSGISPDLLPKIFDPTFTTKERGQGTGLGLSTAQAIVKGHGGFLNVYSELGRGTKFHVYLPAPPTAEMAKAEKERAPLPSGHGELILVVEDEASIREITQVTLETFGYRVLSAADGSEAVSLYAQHRGKIQAVITDMAMPIMAGPATIRALQCMDPAVKVIAISGMDAERMVVEASESAVKAFLKKPFTAEKLLRTLAEALKG